MSATRSLPPTQRDFDIYHAIQITGLTTRRVAADHDLSQTRVRQIVAQVVEWIADVLPPEADIAKEKRAQLARHIAADRLQHQLEEASERWTQTSAPKYMSLLTRITVANARLGVVSGTIDGLTADVLEGLPVGAAVSESCNSPLTEPTVEPPSKVPNSKSQIPNSPSRRPIDSDQAELLNAFRNIWPRTERIRLAVELEEALQFLPPEHREAIRASEARRLSPHQLTLEAAVRAGHIPGDEAFLIDPASYTPPVGDCSTENESTDAALPSESRPQRENQDSTFTCDDNLPSENPHRPAQNAPSQPLLTTSNQTPVTQLTLTPKHSGAPIAVITPHT